MKLKVKSAEPLVSCTYNSIVEHLSNLLIQMYAAIGHKQKTNAEIKTIVTAVLKGIKRNSQVYYNFGLEHLTYTFEQAQLGEYGEIKGVGSVQIMNWIKRTNDERKRIRFSTTEEKETELRQQRADYWKRQIPLTVKQYHDQAQNDNLTILDLQGRSYLYDWLVQEGHINPTKDQKMDAWDRAKKAWEARKKNARSDNAMTLAEAIERNSSELQVHRAKQEILFDWLKDVITLPFEDEYDWNALSLELEPSIAERMGVQ